MPHIPDLRSHDAHDLELVAAFAAGDAAGTVLETAAALVAGCAECAALHHDLRAIAAAMPALPAPVRPRDFRLTPEQAAAIRPAGWRRLLGTLAGPSFRFAAPLGTGLAALGITAILVGSFASVPLGSGSAAEDVARNNAAGAEAAPTIEAAPTTSSVDGFVTQGEPGTATAPMDDPFAAAPAPEASPADVATELALDQDPESWPWLVPSVAAVVAGAVLLIGRLLARRLVRRPG